MSKRISILLIGAFMVTTVSLLVRERLMRYPIAPGTIPTLGGKEMSIQITDDKIDYYYLQADPEWGEERIGGSGETIRQVGCTLCSLATAVSSLGHEIDPSALNQNLIQYAGYTERGWLVWGAVPAATNGFAEVIYCNEPTYQQLDSCLEKREFSLVKIFLPGMIPHWVTVVGKEGQEYLVKDPALSGRKIVKLSTRAPAIHALRYVRQIQK